MQHETVRNVYISKTVIIKTAPALQHGSVKISQKFTTQMHIVTETWVWWMQRWHLLSWIILRHMVAFDGQGISGYVLLSKKSEQPLS